MQIIPRSSVEYLNAPYWAISYSFCMLLNEMVIVFSALYIHI